MAGSSIEAAILGHARVQLSGGDEKASWLVHHTGRCCVRELLDSIGDQAPDRGAVVIAFGCELGGTCGAFLAGVLAVALEHQGGSPPDVDVRYHGTKAYERAIQQRLNQSSGGAGEACPLPGCI